MSTVFAHGQVNQFAPGWDLDPTNSKINFRSIKNEDGKEIVETHSFATMSGTIEETGASKVTVKLDSVDTNNDLRNVRMRFLFFETFKYPDATVSTRLTAQMAEELAVAGTKTYSLPIDVGIHGVTRALTAQVTVNLENNDLITVSSAQPIIFNVDDFGLSDSLKKIAVTAGGFDIFPSMTITFQLSFARRGGASAPVIVQADTTTAPADVAVETQGEFSLEECTGRFEILSETGNIYFASGSARLDSESRFVLNSILDIIRRCRGLRILISGHTDDVGQSDYNQRLSEQRARSVYDYFVRDGIDPSLLFTTGFGEGRPMLPNDSAFNKSRNRRIEFSLYR